MDKHETRTNDSANGKSDSTAPPKHEPVGYEIGYCRPPKQHQFPKGQSGNRRGRPKGRRSFLSLLDDALNEHVVVHEGGQRKKIKKRVAAAKQIANKAASGDYRTAKLLLELDQSPEWGEQVNHEAELTGARQRISARLQKYAEAAKAEDELIKSRNFEAEEQSQRKSQSPETQ